MRFKIISKYLTTYDKSTYPVRIPTQSSKRKNIHCKLSEMNNRLFNGRFPTNELSETKHGPVGMELIRWPEPVTPTKMASSPSKFGAYASPMKSAFPLRSPGRTPLKHVNNLSPLKGVGNGGSRSNSFGDGCFPADTSFLSEPLPTFKPLETPSTWSFKWTKPINDLGHLERILKANCRFLAQYDRVGENVLMHLPFCVRVDTLKQKLADHLRDISFSRVMVTDLDEQDVLDIIMKSL